MCHFRTRTQEPPLQWNYNPSAPTPGPPLPLSGAHAGPAAAPGRERPRRGAGARTPEPGRPSALGRRRSAPRSSTWARAGWPGGRRRPRTHGAPGPRWRTMRPARPVLCPGVISLKRGFSDPRVWPEMPFFLLFSLPPPRDGDSTERGLASNPRLSDFFFGILTVALAPRRVFPLRVRHKDLGAQCLLRPRREAWSPAGRWRATRGWETLALATPPAGWPPCVVRLARCSQPEFGGRRLRGESLRSARWQSHTPQMQNPRLTAPSAQHRQRSHQLSKGPLTPAAESQLIHRNQVPGLFSPSSVIGGGECVRVNL